MKFIKIGCETHCIMKELGMEHFCYAITNYKFSVTVINMTRKQIERKYGVKIVENGYYSFYGKYVKLYDMYSADLCRWDTGFLTIKGVEQECKKWEKELLDIKESAYIAEIMKRREA